MTHKIGTSRIVFAEFIHYNPHIAESGSYGVYIAESSYITVIPQDTCRTGSPQRSIYSVKLTVIIQHKVEPGKLYNRDYTAYLPSQVSYSVRITVIIQHKIGSG